MPLTIATWNINSVRLRIASVLRFLRAEAPDILCLQEIKTTEDAFPGLELASLGYVHQAVRGQAGYHGVATVSRVPFRKTWSEGFCERGHARHVAVLLESGLELHNVYVPAGGDIPDPKTNDKFAHKLAFLRSMSAYFEKLRGKQNALRALVGDLNIAPLEHDVWSHKQLLKVVSHTPVEVEHLNALKASHDFLDVTRHVVPEPQKIYTWWSYRAHDWEASDRGRRLDHLWLAPALKDGLVSTAIRKSVRGWARASDHAPVIATLDIPGASRKAPGIVCSPRLC
jgi:exodeoxyribonuclease-3